MKDYNNINFIQIAKGNSPDTMYTFNRTIHDISGSDFILSIVCVIATASIPFYYSRKNVLCKRMYTNTFLLWIAKCGKTKENKNYLFLWRTMKIIYFHWNAHCNKKKSEQVIKCYPVFRVCKRCSWLLSVIALGTWTIWSFRHRNISFQRIGNNYS